MGITAGKSRSQPIEMGLSTRSYILFYAARRRAACGDAQRLVVDWNIGI